MGNPDRVLKRLPQTWSGPRSRPPGPPRPRPRPPPQAHLTASPARRKRWMALSAAVIAASARDRSIATAREASRHPRRLCRSRGSPTEGSEGSQGGGTHGHNSTSSGEGRSKDRLLGNRK